MALRQRPPPSVPTISQHQLLNPNTSGTAPLPQLINQKLHLKIPSPLPGLSAIQISTFSPVQGEPSSTNNSVLDSSTTNLLSQKKEDELRRNSKVRQLDAQISELRNDIELLKNVKNKKSIDKLAQEQPKSHVVNLQTKKKADLEKKVIERESAIAEKMKALEVRKIAGLAKFIRNFPIATTQKGIMGSVSNDLVDISQKFYIMSSRLSLPIKRTEGILSKQKDFLDTPFEDYYENYNEMKNNPALKEEIMSMDTGQYLAKNLKLSPPNVSFFDAEESSQRSRDDNEELKNVGNILGALVMWLKAVAKYCGITYPYPMIYDGNRSSITDNHFSEPNAKPKADSEFCRQLRFSEKKIAKHGNLSSSSSETSEDTSSSATETKKDISVFTNNAKNKENATPNSAKNTIQCYPLWWNPRERGMFDYAVKLFNGNVSFLCQSQGLIISRTKANDFSINLICFVKMIEILDKLRKEKQKKGIAILKKENDDKERKDFEIIMKVIDEKKDISAPGEFEKQELCDNNYFIHDNVRYELKFLINSGAALDLNESVIATEINPLSNVLISHFFQQ